MIFKESRLKGVYIIEPERISDHRGYFSRSFCKEEFEQHGLDSAFVQCNISYNRKKGTVRGMHYQCSPYQESKTVNCISGSIFDVIIDLRIDSGTYLEWESFTLTKDNKHMLYIPKGFAHGFYTLEDDSEVFYQMSEFHHPECARGVRWNDPKFDIRWPEDEGLIISERDGNYDLWKECFDE
jgi:dTDP-4-dehydrorhamnose 3,5-epimerase